jgi:hypothetical protein
MISTMMIEARFGAATDAWFAPAGRFRAVDPPTGGACTGGMPTDPLGDVGDLDGFRSDDWRR